MQLSYQLRESLHSLTTNPLRSSLSIVGVVFGVASVVAMLGIGLGAEKEIEALLNALGAQNVHVTGDDLDDEAWNRVLRSSTGLSERDLMLAKELFPAAPVARVATWKTTEVNKPMADAKLTIYGATANLREILGGTMAAGRSFSDYEDAEGRPVALLGEGLAKSWFGDAAKAVGETVRIDRMWFHVIGVLEGSSDAPADDEGGESSATTSTSTSTNTSTSAGASAAKPGGGDQAGVKLLQLGRAVIVPLNSAVVRLGPKGALAPLERLILKLPTGVDPINARQRLQYHLSRLHRGAQVVTVTAADEVIEQKRGATRLFSYFLLTIALISLVVGGIGIANVMLASMVERIREVGLRRAIGAKRRHIMTQFLTEALAICLIGGALGGVLGLGVAWAIGLITGWNVAFPWWGLLVALVIATIVGTLAGLYPALTAARISPIEALQGRA